MLPIPPIKGNQKQPLISQGFCRGSWYETTNLVKRSLKTCHSTLGKQWENMILLLMEEILHQLIWNISHFHRVFHQQYGNQPKQCTITHKDGWSIHGIFHCIWLISSINHQHCTMNQGKSINIAIPLHQVWFPSKWFPFNDPWRSARFMFCRQKKTNHR